MERRQREREREGRRDKKFIRDVSSHGRGTFEKISRETRSFSFFFFFFFFFPSGEEVKGRKARKGGKDARERKREREKLARLGFLFREREGR